MVFITISKPIAEVSKYTCHFYRTEYISRNELFRHLNDSYMADISPAAPIVANVITAVSLSKTVSLLVLEEPNLQKLPLF